MQPIAPVTIADLLAPAQQLLYKFEVYDGANWLDLCSLEGKSYVKKDGISLSLGGAGMSPDPVAASWSAEIDNEDGIFHPFHPTSEYADLFRIGREVRISLGGVFKKFLAPFEAWSNRKLIALPIPTANLTNFPNKVPIVADAAIGAKCRADGFDIRFTASDGVTLLKYERESFAVAGGEASGIFWVKSNVAMAGTYIWCYYGNPFAADGADPEAVWDANFKLVYHMKDATTSTILDSTGNNNDGAKKGANEPIEADGKIAKGQDFDGTNDYINCGNDTGLSFGTGDFTIECWIKTTQVTGARLIGRRGDDAKWYSLLIGIWEAGKLFFETGAITPTPSDITVNDGNLHHVVLVKSGLSANYFIDSVPRGSTEAAADVGNLEALILGAWDYSPPTCTSFFDGIVDEARISSIARSAAWIAYEYANMNPADGGLTWGAEESPQVPNYTKYWQRLIGYMDAPRFDHGSRSVSLSGCDYMKRLADTIIRSSPLDQETINGPSHWGARAVFDSVASYTPTGAELYTYGDALDPITETETISEAWEKSLNANFVAESAGPPPPPTYSAKFSINSGSTGWVKSTAICSPTKGKSYLIKFNFYRPLAATYKIELAQFVGATRIVLWAWTWANVSTDWAEKYATIVALSNNDLEFRIDGSGMSTSSYLSLEYISIKEREEFWWRYSMPAGCNGPYYATLDDEPIWQGDAVKDDGSGGGWYYDENTNYFYFDEKKSVLTGTANLKVYYYTDQSLDNVTADLLVAAGYYANRAAALAAMDYTPTGLTIPRVWFESDTSALAAVKLICERADYRFWFDEAGTPCFQPNPSSEPPPPPAGDVYYVDQTGGLDTNDGLSESTPWKTIAKVNAAALAPDDQVLFKRGETWAEELKPTSSGSDAAHPIIFGAYGIGVPPKITGATRALDANVEHDLTFRGIIFAGKEVRAYSTFGINFEYCLLRDSNANGLNSFASTVYLKNCLVIGARDDGVLADGDGAVVDLKNTLVIANGGGVAGSTYGGGGLNAANGGTINYSYSNITGNGYRPDWNVRGATGGSNNQLQTLPRMERPMKDAAFFTITVDDAGYAYAQAAAAAIEPYGGRLTFFVIPSLIDAAGETALAALATAGHEIAVHSWSHAGLTITEIFEVTSTNTAPTVDVDVPTTTITLWCDEVANRVTFNWSGNKTIGDLKIAVAGKGWTVTNKSTVADALRLACLADSGGAQAAPYTTAPDVSSPNYAFWYQEVIVAQDWIENITGIRPKTMAYPYGYTNAALQTWLKNQGFEGARWTNDIMQTLSSIEIYNNRNVYDLKGDGSEAQTKASARHHYELCKQTARMLCFYVHNTGDLSVAQWGWFAQELAACGAQLQTFGSYVSAVRASHTPSGDGLTYTKTYPDVSNFHLTPASPCINAGFSVGLDEDIEGTPAPQAAVYDIGPYEFLMTTPATPTFEGKDLKGCQFYQDIGMVRNRVVIEGIEQGMYAAREDKKTSRLTGEASDPSSIEAYLEKTHKVTNYLFQDQASIDAMVIALLAEWKDPKDYAALDLFANPIPLELGDVIGIKLLLQKVGEIEYFVDRAATIRDISIDGSRAGYKVEIEP